MSWTFLELFRAFSELSGASGAFSARFVDIFHEFVDIFHEFADIFREFAVGQTDGRAHVRVTDGQTVLDGRTGGRAEGRTACLFLTSDQVT